MSSVSTLHLAVCLAAVQRHSTHGDEKTMCACGRHFALDACYKNPELLQGTVAFSYEGNCPVNVRVIRIPICAPLWCVTMRLEAHFLCWGFTCQNHDIIMRHTVVESSRNPDHLGLFQVHWKCSVHGPLPLLPRSNIWLPHIALNPCPSCQQPSTTTTVPPAAQEALVCYYACCWCTHTIKNKQCTVEAKACQMKQGTCV